MDKIWYYMKNDRQKYGPYTDAELINLIRQEILLAEDYIWMPDLTEWLKIGDSIYSEYLPTDETEIDITQVIQRPQ